MIRSHTLRTDMQSCATLIRKVYALHADQGHLDAARLVCTLVPHPYPVITHGRC